MRAERTKKRDSISEGEEVYLIGVTNGREGNVTGNVIGLTLTHDAFADACGTVIICLLHVYRSNIVIS